MWNFCLRGNVAGICFYRASFSSNSARKPGMPDHDWLGISSIIVITRTPLQETKCAVW